MRFASWDNGVASPVTLAIAQQFARATPRVILRQETTSFGTHFDQLRQSLAAKNPPDVFLNSGAYFYEQLKSGGLLDLSPFLTGDNLKLDGYWTDPISQPINGGQFAVPLWCDDEVVFINRDVVAAAGLTMPSNDWSWDDLLNLATHLTVGKPGQVSRWGLLLIDDVQGGWGSFVATNGGHWLDPTTGKATFDAAAQSALQWLVDAINLHHVAPRPSEQQALTQAGQVDPFLAGSVALMPQGTWAMTAALTNNQFAWDVQRLPRATATGRSVTMATAQPASAAHASTHPEQSWQLLRYFLSGEAQRAWLKDKVRLPALRSVASDPAAGYVVAPPANVAVAVQAMDDRQDLGFSANWQAVRAAVVSALEPAFEGQSSLTDAIAAATKAGNIAST